MTDHLKDLDAAAELGKAATKRPWHHEPSDSGDSSVGLDGYGASVYAMRDGSDDPIEVADMKYPAFKVEPQDEFDDGTRYDGSQDDNGAYLAASANLDHAAIAAELRAKDAEIESLRAAVLNFCQKHDAYLQAVGEANPDDEHISRASEESGAALAVLEELVGISHELEDDHA